MASVEALLRQIVSDRDGRPGVGLTNREIESLLTVPNRMLALEKGREADSARIGDLAHQIAALNGRLTGDGDKPGVATRLILLETDAGRMRWLATVLVVSVAGLLAQKLAGLLGGP